MSAQRKPECLTFVQATVYLSADRFEQEQSKFAHEQGLFERAHRLDS